jgi:hypothetical protein
MNATITVILTYRGLTRRSGGKFAQKMFRQSLSQSGHSRSKAQTYRDHSGNFNTDKFLIEYLQRRVHLDLAPVYYSVIMKLMMPITMIQWRTEILGQMARRKIDTWITRVAHHGGDLTEKFVRGSIRPATLLLSGAHSEPLEMLRASR